MVGHQQRVSGPSLTKRAALSPGGTLAPTYYFTVTAMQKPNIKTLYDKTMRCETPDARVNEILRGYKGRDRQERAQLTARSIRQRKAIRVTSEGHYGNTKRDERMARRMGKSYRERQRAAKGTPKYAVVRSS